MAVRDVGTRLGQADGRLAGRERRISTIQQRVADGTATREEREELTTQMNSHGLDMTARGILQKSLAFGISQLQKSFIG